MYVYFLLNCMSSDLDNVHSPQEVLSCQRGTPVAGNSSWVRSEKESFMS